ncbi:MAG: sporulation transcription factor Spo0A [bacterium]
MENINLIVVDNNEEVTSSISKYFEFRSNINLVGTYKDGEEALSYIINNVDSFDVIVMDLLLPVMDGISLLHNLKRRNINKKIIVLSSYMNEDVTKQVSNIGVDYYMLKPFSLESLEERVVNLFKANYFESNKKANLEIEVSEVLHNLGIPSHIRGYQYIREGIMYVYTRNSYVTYITKEVYPDIADKYKTTPSRVERAIRHAIEISWDRGDLDLMEDLFGHSIDYDRSKPTNSEYINTIADRMKLNNKVAL